MSVQLALPPTHQAGGIEPAGGPGGADRTIVLLHAYPVDGTVWRPQLRALSAAGWRVLAPDLPGFGAAAADAGELKAATIADLADATAAFIRAVAPGPVVLGGMSRGGYISLAVAQRHPDLLAGLLLLDTRPSLDPPEVRRFFTELAATAERGDAASVAEQMLPQVLGPTARATQPDLVDAVRTNIIAQSPAGLAAGALSMNTRTDTSHVLPHIGVPTLVIAGSEDPNAPATTAMAGHIPGAHLLTVPAAGHYVSAEQPAQVNEAVVAFLDRQ